LDLDMPDKLLTWMYCIENVWYCEITSDDCTWCWL